MLPSGYVKIAIEDGPFISFIVDLPIDSMVDLSIVMLARLPEGNPSKLGTWDMGPITMVKYLHHLPKLDDEVTGTPPLRRKIEPYNLLYNWLVGIL